MMNSTTPVCPLILYQGWVCLRVLNHSLNASTYERQIISNIKYKTLVSPPLQIEKEMET